MGCQWGMGNVDHDAARTCAGYPSRGLENANEGQTVRAAVVVCWVEMGLRVWEEAQRGQEMRAFVKDERGIM